MTSKMNPVNGGLEMKRMISLNQGTGVEPIFDLTLNSYHQDHQNQSSVQPQLFNQASAIMLDLNGGPGGVATSNYFPGL